jgi:amino-acid N-acetyltransferase
MSDALHAVIRRGRRDDVAAVQPLLAAAGLPTVDLEQIQDLRLWVLEAGGEPLGVIALECSGTSALLRSLAIAPQHRNRGLGRGLVARLERDARTEGFTRLTLLTETAEPFFRRLGYQPIDRTAVPEDLRQSAEFRSLCPASAVSMSKSL